MEWFWILISIAILFSFLAVCRLMYIRGYKAGAKKVLAEWSDWLNGDESLEWSSDKT